MLSPMMFVSAMEVDGQVKVEEEKVNFLPQWSQKLSRLHSCCEPYHSPSELFDVDGKTYPRSHITIQRATKNAIGEASRSLSDLRRHNIYSSVRPTPRSFSMSWKQTTAIPASTTFASPGPPRCPLLLVVSAPPPEPTSVCYTALSALCLCDSTLHICVVSQKRWLTLYPACSSTRQDQKASSQRTHSTTHSPSPHSRTSRPASHPIASPTASHSGLRVRVSRQRGGRW